jgi:hypothetical protein
MLTDARPQKTSRAGFLESDRIKSLDLPQNVDLPEVAYRLESAMKADNIRDVIIVRLGCEPPSSPPICAGQRIWRAAK